MKNKHILIVTTLHVGMQLQMLYIQQLIKCIGVGVNIFLKPVSHSV